MEDRYSLLGLYQELVSKASISKEVRGFVLVGSVFYRQPKY